MRWYMKKHTMPITKAHINFTLVLLVLFMSCKSQKQAQTDKQPDLRQPEGMELVLSDNYGGTATPELMILRDAGELKRFFININKTRKPGLPIPKIDFSSHIALVYCSGKITGSGIPSLYALEETPEKLVLAQTNIATAESDTSTALIVPFALYTLPLTEKEITLKPNK